MFFGLPGNQALHADPVIVTKGDACATDRAVRKLVELRRSAETRYAAKIWGKPTRRVVARIEASTLRLIKLAARVIETATRIRVAFASACPEAGTFRQDRSRPLPGADLASAAVPPTPPPVQKLRKSLENPADLVR